MNDPEKTGYARFKQLFWQTINTHWLIAVRCAYWGVVLWATSSNFDLTEFKAIVLGVFGEAGLQNESRKSHLPNIRE